MTVHEVQAPIDIRDGIYTRGVFGACSCGWTGPERGPSERGTAIWDVVTHAKSETE